MASHFPDDCRNNETWYLDSGCTSHMCNNSALFTNLNSSDQPLVKMGDDHNVQAAGRGTIAVETKKGVRYIDNVLLVPNLGQNLLSVAQMMKSHYVLHFEGSDCAIVDPNGIEIARVAVENDSFPLKLKPALNHVFISTVDKTLLWHRRYGHYNLKSLLYLQSNGLVRDMPNIQMSSEVCECCQLGKAHRQSFSTSSARRAKEKLELVYSDVCGPMRIPSLSQNKYFILFVDDLTRMTWVYFLTYKSQVFSVFKKFKQMVELQSGCLIKTLRTDNGKEYTSSEFSQFCEDLGIERQLTVPYTPEQNGVCERKNRTVMEMARCMLIEKGMPKEFWAEAVYTATYLLNRLPTKAVADLTPIEAWSGNKPSAKHLKVFGSICYSHIPDKRRDKLSDKAERGVLLGYSSQSKGYRVFNLETGKVEVKRDVIIDEDCSWNWNNKIIVKKNLIEVKEADLQDHYTADLQDQNTAEPTTSNSNSAHASSSSQVFLDEDESSSDDQEQGTASTSSGSPVARSKSLAEIYERCMFVAAEPICYSDAIKNEDWKTAMLTELDMIEKNNTWELTARPTHKKPIGVKWVYKTKFNSDGSVFKHKARLVVKGYAQQFGVDYFDTFAPIARLDTVKLLIAISAAHNWKIHQLDVKSAFLNGVLDEEIYVEQPEGFVVRGREDCVYKLHKALYGLKQAPRAWYSRINAFLLEHNFKRSENEATLYIKHFPNGSKLLISLYVDDLLITGDDPNAIEVFKLAMKNQFDMTDLGLMHYFLGMEIQQCENEILVSQKRFSENILKKFKMNNCKPVSSPLIQREKLSKNDGAKKIDATVYRSLIGSLLYLTNTRPDLMFATSLLSRFMSSPSEIHFASAKRVLRYLKGSVSLGLKFSKSQNCSLVGYVDSDWAGCLDDSRSTSGYLFMYGGNVFCWNSKKQEVVAQSSAEAEYIAAASAATHVIWLRKILIDLGLVQAQGTDMFCDNLSTIAIAKNPVQHGRTKHIKVKYHFLREAENDKEINLLHCKSEDQLADMLTKPLSTSKLDAIMEKLGVCDISLRRSVGN